MDPQKNTRGTRPLSLASRMLIRQRFQKKRRTITWKEMVRGVGAYVGRWVPWIGAVLTAYDLSIISRNVVHRYMLITGEKG